MLPSQLTKNRLCVLPEMAKLPKNPLANSAAPSYATNAAIKSEK
jgi:hypothetical protein